MIIGKKATVYQNIGTHDEPVWEQVSPFIGE